MGEEGAHGGKRDLFQALDTYLREEKKHVEEVFEGADSDGDGRLGSQELQVLIDTVLPGGCSAEERRYFQILMDFNGDGYITQEEMLLGIEDCRTAKSEIDLHDVLARLRFMIEDTGSSLTKEFSRADLDGSGFLEYSEVAALVQRIFLSLTDSELRRVIMHVQRIDADGDGRISLQELQVALESSDFAADGIPPTPTSPNALFSSEDPLERSSLSDPNVLRGSQTPVQGLDELRVWRLQQYMVKGDEYLVDRATGLVYRDSPRTGFPFIVGELSGSTVLVTRGARDLFHELDHFLKSSAVQLRRLFNDFDSNGNDSLEAEEVGSLLGEVLPGCTDTDKKFFDVMLDVEGRGSISYASFVQAITECQKLGTVRSLRGQIGVEDAMVHLLENLKRQNASLHNLFSSLDAQGCGKLDFRTLVGLVSTIVPHYETRDLRYCLIQFAEADADKDGALSEQEVAQCLQMVRVEKSHAVQLNSGSVCDQPLPWTLEKHMMGGVEYLVDPVTQGAFTYSRIMRAPFPQGHLEGPNVIGQGNGRRELFHSIEQYVAENSVSLRDTFNEFDTEQRGSLDSYELHRLLDRLLPGVTTNEGLFFSTMMDIDGNGAVTLQEMTSALRECKEIFAWDSTEEVERLMARLHQHVDANSISLREVVEKFDMHGVGAVNYRQLAHLMAALLPDVEKGDLRRIVGHFQLLDVEDQASVSYEELMHALGFVVVEMSNEVVTIAAYSAPVVRERSNSSDATVQWDLLQRTINGVEYLLDEDRGLLYKMNKRTGQPILRGKPNGRGGMSSFRGQDLFSSMDVFLKEKKARLREAFNKFDTDGNGSLSRDGLGRLLKTIKPEGGPADMRYFSTMLDIEGDDSVSFEEMLEGLRECKSIADAANALFELDAEEEEEEGGLSDVESVIQLLSDAVRQSKQSVLKVFSSLDKDGTGFLEMSALAQLARSIMPSLTRKQVRTIVSYFNAIDVNKDARLSYPEVAKVLFLAKVCVSSPRSADEPHHSAMLRPGNELASGGSPPQQPNRQRRPETILAQQALRKSSGKPGRTTSFEGIAPMDRKSWLGRTSSNAGRTGSNTGRTGSNTGRTTSNTGGRTLSRTGSMGGSEGDVDAPRWRMLERIFNEKSYMIDPETSHVYSSMNGSPPILVGKMALGQLKTDSHPPDIIGKLSTAIRERSDRLKVLFQKYDLDLSGFLDPSELTSLLTTFMPDITIPEARFCMVLLDMNGDGEVSLDEMRRMVSTNATLYSHTEVLLRRAGEVMSMILEEIRASGMSPKSEFERCDAEMSGKLTLPSVAELLRKLVPDMNDEDRILALTYIYYCDFSRSGVYSYAQLMRCFGLVRLVLESSDKEKRVLAKRKKRSSLQNMVSATVDEVVWKVVTVTVKGEGFWVDRETNLVYRPASEGEWPKLHGKLSGVAMIDTDYQQVDLFQGMDRYLQERNVQLELLFKKFDWTKCGSLEISELSNLLLDMMPAATEHECNYFRVMMNIVGAEERLSYQSFLQAMAESREAASYVTVQDPRLTALLRKVGERVRTKELDLMEIFYSFDMDCDDQLEMWEANSMLQSLLPTGTVKEKRILLSQVAQWDLNRDGRITFPEVMRGLRLAKIRVMGNKVAVAKAAKGSKLLSDWNLKIVQVSGVPLLLDRQMGMAFRESQHDGYPMLVGTVANGELVRGGTELQLFAHLEPFLAERKVRLREAFSQVDWDGSGMLRSSDYLLFLRELLPSVTHGDRIFFETMLDAGQQRGSVTYTELLEALHECLRITMAISSGSEQVVEALELLVISFSDSVKEAQEDPSALFEAEDTSGNGFLDFRELAGLLLQRQPSLSATQIRFMVTLMRSWDRQDQGKMSMTDFVRAFRLTNVKVDHDGSGAGGRSVSQLGVTSLMPNLYSGTSFNPGSVTDVQRARSSSVTPATSLRASFPSGQRSSQMAALRRSSGGVRSPTSVSISWDSGRHAAAGVSGSTARLSTIFGDPIPSAHSPTSSRSRSGFSSPYRYGGGGGGRESAAGQYSWDGGKRQSSVSVDDNKARSSDGAGWTMLRRSSSTVVGASSGGRGANDRLRESCAVRTASLAWVGGAPMPVGSGGVQASSPLVWELEETVVEGEVYLYDRETEYIYSPSARTGYPEFVGRAYSEGGGGVHAEYNFLRLEKRTNWGDIFQTLVELVKVNKQHVNDLFRKYDYDHSNALETNEVFQFLKALVPRASAADTIYFRVMLGMEDDEVIDFNALLDSIATAGQVGDAVRRKENGAVEGLLSKLGSNVSTHGVDPVAVFHAANVSRNGTLDFLQARVALRELLPSLTEQQMRYIVCHLYYQDLDGSGRISLKQFITGLRLATVSIRFLGESGLPELQQVVSREAVPREAPLPSNSLLARSPVYRGSSRAAPELRRSGHATLADWEHRWTLETMQYAGNTVLVDPQDKKVFDAPDGRYPVPLGRLLASGQVEDNRRPRDIFTELCFLVQEKRTTLRALLDQHTTSVSLSRNDLANVLDSLVSNVSEAELNYFQVMVDVDEAGHFTLDDTVTRFEECGSIASDVYSQGSQELEEVLQRLGLYVLEAGVSIFTAVEKLSSPNDSDGSEKYVHVLDQGKLLRMLSPSLSERELRFLLANLSVWDVDGSGFASYRDVVHSLRLAKVAVYDVTPSGSRAQSQEFLCLDNFRSPAPNMREAARSEAKEEHLLRSQHLEWPLTRLIASRQQFLLDRRTKRVYKPGFNSYPQLFGLFKGEAITGLNLRDGSTNVLLMFGQMLNERGVNLRQLFSKFEEEGGNGMIESKELQSLLHRAVNTAQPHDMLYFQSMLDITDAGRLSYEAVSGAIEEAVASVQYVISRPASVEELMEDLQEDLEAGGGRLRVLWDKMDPRRAGYLDYGQIAKLLRGACSTVNNHHLRAVVHQCHAHDTNALGQLSYMELIQVLHMADVCIEPEPIVLKTAKAQAKERRHGPPPVNSQRSADVPVEHCEAEVLGGAFGQDIRLSAEFEQRTDPHGAAASAYRSERAHSGPRASSFNSSPPRQRGSGRNFVRATRGESEGESSADSGFSNHRLETTIDPERDAVVVAGGASLAGLSAGALAGQEDGGAKWDVKDEKNIASQGSLARQTMDHANGTKRHVKRLYPPWMARRQLLKSGAHNGLSATVVTADGTAVSGVLRDVEYTPGVAVRPHVLDNDGDKRDAFSHSHWDLIDQMSQPGAKAQWRKTGVMSRSHPSASQNGGNSNNKGASGGGAQQAGQERTHPKDFNSRQAWSDFLNPPVRFINSKGQKGDSPERTARSPRSAKTAPAMSRTPAVSLRGKPTTGSPLPRSVADEDDDVLYTGGAASPTIWKGAGNNNNKGRVGGRRGGISVVGDSALKSFSSSAGANGREKRRSEIAASGRSSPRSGLSSPTRSISPPRYAGREAVYREVRRRSETNNGCGKGHRKMASSASYGADSVFDEGGVLEHVRDLRSSVESAHHEYADSTCRKFL